MSKAQIPATRIGREQPRSCDLGQGGDSIASPYSPSALLQLFLYTYVVCMHFFPFLCERYVVCIRCTRQQKLRIVVKKTWEKTGGGSVCPSPSAPPRGRPQFIPLCLGRAAVQTGYAPTLPPPPPPRRPRLPCLSFSLPGDTPTRLLASSFPPPLLPLLDRPPNTRKPQLYIYARPLLLPNPPDQNTRAQSPSYLPVLFLSVFVLHFTRSVK
jgi:hypothetical protein